MPRSQKLWTAVRKSATIDGVVDVRVSNFLISPLFSATITLPSGRKRTAVGLTRPLKTWTSWKDGCLYDVCAKAAAAAPRASKAAKPRATKRNAEGRRVLTMPPPGPNHPLVWGKYFAPWSKEQVDLSGRSGTRRGPRTAGSPMKCGG